MRLRWVSVVLLVLASVAAPAVADAVGEKPAVDVTVRSTDVSNGDTYESGSDVEITVNASVGDAASAGTALSEVVVRVNGDLATSIPVNGTSVSETVRPDLRDGSNSVRVIVTDDAGSVNATSFTVRKDAEPPHVYLTSPYETAPWKPIGDGSANGTRATIAGNIIEETSVTELRIVRWYDGHRTTETLRNVDENFSVDLLLGPAGNNGTLNRIRLTATDEFGNFRPYEFSVEVTDDAEPELSLRPFPNETADNRIFLAGTVTDDVSVGGVNVTVRDPSGNVTGTYQARPSYSGPFDDDRYSLAFNDSIYPLYTGTYEVTVTATDTAGKSVSETVTFERVSQADVAPTVAVDRSRTVVVGTERLFLSGVAFQGVTERVVVETRNATTGGTVDYQVVHAGSLRERVEFDREVSIAPGRTTVIVRATDAKGEEHTERFAVDGTTRETFVDEDDAADESPWPAVSVEPLQDGRPGTASSSVSVRRASAGTTVAVPAGNASTVVGTANVSVERLRLDVAADTNLTATVVARERADGALSGPGDSRVGATVTVQHSVADAAVDGVAYDLVLRRAYLDAHGLDPANLSVYRLSDGNWSSVETAATGSNGSSVRYAVDSPGLSVFSLATEPGAADGDEGGGTAPANNGTDAGVGNETVANGTDSGADDASDDAADEPGPEVVVTNLTVNRTAVTVNESVLVNVSLENRGDASATYTADLRAIHEGNTSQVANRTAVVPPGENRSLELTADFAEPGNHTLAVDGTEAGPVVVSGGGGLLSFLSVLSVLPLRLIGIGLGGLLGLGLVVVLLRFVLGKVGGESADG
ncbi:hypothetical protein C475_20168 [Halosimplex carlsbadense 2-9-1]|uniref:PGF-pre-PGF domain-containing protein n=1 Tax=Halosimplex carlsbadense 2-9-1 TaxID=797114 RepID=M0CBK9_9EURY|nr:hypothetical protein [Halosimplex carlsbadense]ELZ20615.1 hypothetical protein C475_20168 [Halosimplex carlsbadense 2-9-1]